MRRLRASLSLKLLGLTVLFVLFAEILIYVPSMIEFRRDWLRDRVAAARTAALVFEASPDGTIRPEAAKSLLRYVGALTISLKRGDIRWLLASTDDLPNIDVTYDLRSERGLASLAAALAALTASKDRVLRILDAAPTADTEFIELVMPEAPLRQAMLADSHTMIIRSLLICGMVGLLIYFALHIFLVRPLKRLSAEMADFRNNPEDPSKLVTSSGRSDEIGQAEQSLQKMQRELQGALRQKTHLAALGLAVAKINHDLRNILSPIQLFADRLAALPEPNVQRVMPKILSALDRAIAMCQNTLSYGQALEPAPKKSALFLCQTVDDLTSVLDFGQVRFENRVDQDLVIDADPDQLFRILLNLIRNSLQALEEQVRAPEASPAYIKIAARQETGKIIIEIEDSGPGIPPEAREHLFLPFAATKKHGSGLGLAIVAELVKGHAGSISLADSPQGARFVIALPN